MTIFVSTQYLQALLRVDHVPQSIANSAYVTERCLPKYLPQQLRCGLTATSFPREEKETELV